METIQIDKSLFDDYVSQFLDSDYTIYHLKKLSDSLDNISYNKLASLLEKTLHSLFVPPFLGSAGEVHKPLAYFICHGKVSAKRWTTNKKGTRYKQTVWLKSSLIQYCKTPSEILETTAYEGLPSKLIPSWISSQATGKLGEEIDMYLDDKVPKAFGQFKCREISLLDSELPYIFFSAIGKKLFSPKNIIGDINEPIKSRISRHEVARLLTTIYCTSEDLVGTDIYVHKHPRKEMFLDDRKLPSMGKPSRSYEQIIAVQYKPKNPTLLGEQLFRDITP